MARRRCLSRTAWLVALASAGAIAAQPVPVRTRIGLLVDTSSDMLLAGQWRTTSENCPGWNPCTFVGNPSTAQESCNACVRDTIRFRPTCATNWTAICSSDYAACLQMVAGPGACSPTLAVTRPVTTRGDGSAELPGCDLDSDGLAQESRLHAVKQAIRNLAVTRTTVEISPWRLRQIEGGQTCASDAVCPDTPGGSSVLTCEDHDGDTGTSKVCAFDADLLDGPTTAGFEGECSLETHTGAPSTFGCAACDFQSSYDRARCEAAGLDQIRTGGTSPIDGGIATCLPEANPRHRFQREHGALYSLSACDPTGGTQLVSYPAIGINDNRSQVLAWVDHRQTDFASDVELRAHGLRPLAAALRDLRTSTLAAASADTHTPCRAYAAILIAAGTDTCESLAASTAAATSFQNLSFTNGAGEFVPDFDVPVHVIAYSVCPESDPTCAARQDLDAIAAAGATGQAIGVQDPGQLWEALRQIVTDSTPVEVCNGLDDDCDGVADEGLSCAAPGEVSARAVAPIPRGGGS